MSSNSIRLVEETEGDRDGTSDFLFFRIGSSVPLKRADSRFDLSKSPGRPLAISEKYGVLFLVSDGGFMVVKTVDVIELAKGIKEIEEGNIGKVESEKLCVQEKSLLDAQIGDVHILAVSTDSSILAAVVGGVVHFFPVSSLAQKKQESLFVCSIGETGNIKDFLWRKNKETSFIVLSDAGHLYHGKINYDLKDVMDGVEGADWSVEGNSLAVARNNVLSILSPEFKEKLNMSLSFSSWIDNADSNVTVKVDSIKWVRRDSIVVGCVQVTEDNEENEYMVQVITAEKPGFDEASSKTTVITFSDLFHGIVDDIVPPGSGPHLFMNYLKNWDLAFVVNRKNADDHVVLLAWSGEDGKGPICLEFEQENFIPRIELQENRDENLLLGIDIDRVSIHEKIEIVADSEEKVLSPQCILFCLSCEGKLIMFHVARASDPACPPETTEALVKDFSSVLPLSSEPIPSTLALKDEQIVLADAKPKESQAQKPTMIVGPTGEETGTLEAVSSLMAPERASAALDKTEKVPPLLAKSSPTPRINSTAETSMMLRATAPMGDERREASASVGLNKVLFPRNKEVGPTSEGIALKSTSFSISGSTPSDSQGTLRTQTNNRTQGFPAAVRPSAKLPQESVFSSSLERTRAPLRPAHVEVSKESSTPGRFISNNQDAGGGHRVLRFPSMQEPDAKIIKQFYSVDDMTRELDDLLQDIEREGGFRDLCTVSQRNSVLSLEEGINRLSEKFRSCKAKVEEQLKEVQQLQDRRMQVTARQIYMEGLVKQASNGQYWDLWNSQKLGPEFEVKQQKISKMNHALVNELVELERHFNALELRRHGEVGVSPKSSRQNYSLHSLHSTVNSQIAAAEQLSDSLSKHMSLLKLSSPPAKQQSVKKQLLESLGLDYDSTSFQSPSLTRVVHSPESSRRRRDSLDKSWSKFDPPRTTVKRTQQEERFKEEQPPQFRVDQVSKDDHQIKAPLQLPQPRSTSLPKWTEDLPRSSPLKVKVGLSAEDTSLTSKQPVPSKVEVEPPLRSRIAPPQTPPPIKASQPVKGSEIGAPIREPSPESSSRPSDNKILFSSSSISQATTLTSQLQPWGKTPTPTPSAVPSPFSGVSLSTSAVSVPTSSAPSTPSLASLSSIPSVSLSSPPQLPKTREPAPAPPKAVTVPAVSPPEERAAADVTITEEDEMEEEAPEVNAMLSGFALGQPSVSRTAVSKPNPFGVQLGTSAAAPAAPSFSLAAPAGELFKPAAFSLPVSQPVQPSQPLTSSGFSAGGSSGFGRPAQIGVAQQALGSVLGSFGQSRQLGFGAQGAGLPPTGGFAGGGFAAAATAAAGFSALASGGVGGGFAAMSSKPSVFAAAAAAASGGGFGAPAGGFASFGSTQSGGGGFSSFGGAAAPNGSKPPPSLLTQMRK